LALNSGAAVTERPQTGQNALISGISAPQYEQIIIFISKPDYL